MALIIYRRHVKACTKDYEQNHRIFQPHTPKQVKADCDCPIVVSGKLRLEPKKNRHLTTETNRWDKALATAALWEEWEALTDPNPAAEERNITVDEATARYLAYKGPQGQNIDRDTLGKHRVMLLDRIRPFCVASDIQFLKAFDVAENVTDCFLTFKNLNPHHNKKTKVRIDKPLADSTKRAELERYREFFRFCVDQGWLKCNQASKIKLGKMKASPKYGLEPYEEPQVWDAIELVTNRGQMDQYNSKELRVLIMVMRDAGLRISDAVTLDDTQLVPRESGPGYAIKIMSMQKVKREWVRIPITMETAEALLNLNFKGEKQGRKYWFYTGNGERETAVNNWRERVDNLLKLAQEHPHKPFRHHATPHTFRHTFAISMLNQGIDIKMVSRWLGHKNVKTTEDNYGHANQATHIASEQAYDEGIRRQRASTSQSS